MKVIFLDIDGVLNSFRNLAAFQRFPHPEIEGKMGECPKNEMGPEAELDQIAIAMIRKLCEIEGLQIVLHSNWRKCMDAVEFGKRHDLPIIDFTHPRLDKAISILSWIEGKDRFECPKEEPVTDFAIIDDDNIFWNIDIEGNPTWSKMKENFIQTDMENGFTFLNFVSTFLCFSHLDIDEIRTKYKRLRQLRAIEAARNARIATMKKDDDPRTQEQKDADTKEFNTLHKELDSIGVWCVTAVLDRLEG